MLGQCPVLGGGFCRTGTSTCDIGDVAVGKGTVLGI